MILQLNVTTIIILFCTINIVLIGNYHGLVSIYGQDNNNKTTELDNNNRVNNITVNDIDISYKKLGKGDPILLIMGYSGSKNDWDPTLLNNLSKNHTVIVFDNRGVGNTTDVPKNFSIVQLAEDSKGLLDALKINKSDILGYSMGGMIAQELALKHPNLVDDLIIYASHCGKFDEVYFPPKKLQDQFGNLTGTEDEIKKRFVPFQFPNDWKKQNVVKYDEIFSSLKLPLNETLQKQKQAMLEWIGTGGSCDRLNQITSNTLIIAGTADKIIPSINSEILKDKIEGSKLAIFLGGGHALMFQFPEKLTTTIEKFLTQ